jgi:DNA-directed RNA polymerase subunit RPC12/RpoP
METDERHSEVTITCPHCKQKQIVHLQVRAPSIAQVSGPQWVLCVKCQSEFAGPGMAKIIAGPFAI